LENEALTVVATVATSHYATCHMPLDTSSPHFFWV